MKAGSKYWSLVRLDSSGSAKITEIVSTKSFFQQHIIKENNEDKSDSSVQRDLVAIKTGNGNIIEADRSLRCFVSHQIKQACIQLEMQFGREHGFSRKDLFIYTLNDTLDNFRDTVARKRSTSQYKPLAVEIVETFDPSKANLSTWTTRFVKQNRELQRFLLEQGVYLISNWAILNDTNIKQLSRILSQFHNLTLVEIDRASTLLSSYHHIYRRDRLESRLGKGGKCQTPTAEQLARIAREIKQASDLILSPEQVLTQLEQLANLLREYRIYARGGRLKNQQSFDNAEINTERMQASVTTEEDKDEDNRNDFLKSYQQQFQQSLAASIEEVVTTRLSKFKGKKAAKAPQYVNAMKLFHCDGETMGKIAKAVGLKAQFQVSRLLNLKELRADIRHKILQSMTSWTLDRATIVDRVVLKQRERAIALALGEQIDEVLDTAEKQATVAQSNESILAKRICEYVDSIDSKQ